MVDKDEIRDSQHCQDTCPIAIRNSEQITTLFNRIDDERETVKMTVRWAHFMWIMGGMFTVFLLLVGVMHTTANQDYNTVQASAASLAKDVAHNSRAIDVAVSRINDFMVSNDRDRRRNSSDQIRIIDKLDEISKTVQKIQVKIGKIELNNASGPTRPQ